MIHSNEPPLYEEPEEPIEYDETQLEDFIEKMRAFSERPYLNTEPNE